MKDDAARRSQLKLFSIEKQPANKNTISNDELHNSEIDEFMTLSNSLPVTKLINKEDINDCINGDEEHALTDDVYS